MRIDHRSRAATTKAAGVHLDSPRAFRRDSRGYWRSWCNPCQLAATQEWRERHRDELNARRRAAR